MSKPKDFAKNFIHERHGKDSVKKEKAKEPKGDRSIINAYPTKAKFAKADPSPKPTTTIARPDAGFGAIKDKTKPVSKPNYGKVTIKKAEFIKNFKKSYDYRDLAVSVDSGDQKAAEATANKDLVSYLKASIDGDLQKIPLEKGLLTLSKKGPGLFSGFFQDRDGQIVEKFDDQTVEMVAKNLELKELYLVPETPKITPPSSASLEQVDQIAEAHIDHHNATMHNEDSRQGPNIKIRYGNFELEIKKSIHNFANDFKKYTVSVDEKQYIKKAIKAWRRNNSIHFSSDLEAAKELVKDWEMHKEGFNQILFVLQQKNGK